MREILHEGCVERLIQHEAKPSAVLASRHAPSAIFPALHERDRCFNWFIVSAANALLWLHRKHVHVLFKFA